MRVTQNIQKLQNCSLLTCDPHAVLFAELVDANGRLQNIHTQMQMRTIVVATTTTATLRIMDQGTMFHPISCSSSTNVEGPVRHTKERALNSYRYQHCYPYQLRIGHV